jgi:NADPH:quinone reductase-like Zn-dependent oxidoreductase
MELSMPVTSRRVIEIAKFGGPEVLQEKAVPVPVPGQGELLVKNEAAGVNPVDYKIRSGKYPDVKEDKLPYILGRDVSGTIVQCGPSVSAFKVGDALIAMPAIDRGGYAEYVLVKETEAAHKPAALDSIGGGAVPLAALTAWQGLFRHGQVKEGQKVLIHGGSGGVGHFAIQFAKAKGAFVATTVSGENIDFVRGLGADQAIDYKAQRFEDELSDIDMVFDLVAGEARDRSWAVLKRGGILVSTLTRPSQEKADQFGVRAMRYTVEESGHDLSKISQLIDQGKVRPMIAKTYPFERAIAAQIFLEKEHPAGKIVLVID